MSAIARDTISVTSSTTQGITVYSSPFRGELVDFSITTVGGSTTADWTVTHEATTDSIWAQSNVTVPLTRVPRRAIQTSTGGSLGLSTTGGPLAPERFAFDNERIKFVVAQAGAAKAYTIKVRINGTFLSVGGSTA